ncbi:alpha/beta hydrolase [Cognatishimia sp. MH4019]|uniref:alpha/beta hydrolase n=1 Tax=Cognatishimia sp. MH4019 TaxID=2854030 RepID=UPI001CD3F3AF|nr:alpha/beta fold hydrolase [Cognatishimia sp. MH4019]
MDLTEILALIASLSGEPEIPDQFAPYFEGGAASAYPITVVPCPLPLARNEIEGDTVICGTVNVPERHEMPDGKRIDLYFTVMRAHSAVPEPDPVLHLHGGPGGGAVTSIEMYAGIFEPLRRTRDIVMFDQRAAVLSSQSTTCRAALDQSIGNAIDGTFSFVDVTSEDGSLTAADLLTECVAEIEATGTDLAAYNTVENANDAVALMEALGYDSYNVHGISYGTRLTLEILRSHPENVRSAVIDGVAPLQVALYDTLALPASEAMDILIDQCAADEACNAAFPDFREVLTDTLNRAIDGELLLADGTPVPMDSVIMPMYLRNGTYPDPSDATSTYPAYIYELARLDEGGPTPVLDMIEETEGYPRRPSPLEGVRDGLLDAEVAAVDDAEASAEIAAQANMALEGAVDALRQRRVEINVPLARIFDDEMIQLAGDVLEDDDKRRAALLGYAQLREGPPSADALRGYVTDTFPADSQPRLLGLVDAMSDAEIAAIFADVQRGVRDTLSAVTGDLHLWIYACQESIPHNSIEGYRETSAALSWPQFGLLYDEAAETFFAACEAFTPLEIPDFHDPVVSDIPVLSLGSAWDVQTAPSWPALAAETLSNAQVFLIPEAGHGAIAYQDCVGDLTQAFLTDPMRSLPDTCEQGSLPHFYVPE